MPSYAMPCHNTILCLDVIVINICQGHCTARQSAVPSPPLPPPFTLLNKFIMFLHFESAQSMNFRNATTTMAPSAVITSQRNSVQRDWEKARDRDEQALERERENNRERGRAEAESLNSCGSSAQDAEMEMDMGGDRDMDVCEGVRVASTSRGK